MAQQKKQADLSNPINCVCLNLRKTSRNITRIYDDALKKANIRSTQFSILSYIHYKKVITITVLAGELDMDRTTLTRNLGPLERDGLILIQTGEDPRSKEVTLTGKGEKILLRALPLWEKVQNDITSLLGKAKAISFLQDMEEIKRKMN